MLASGLRGRKLKTLKKDSLVTGPGCLSGWTVMAFSASASLATPGAAHPRGAADAASGPRRGQPEAEHFLYRC